MQGPGMERMQVREFRMSGRMEGERGFMLERLLRDSDLRQKVGITDEQAAKIRQESTSFRISEIRNRANLQVQRLELGNLMSADKPDRAAIDKKLEEISATQLAAAKAGVDFRLTMRDALTPEQRAKLKQLAMEHHQFDERGAWGRGGPGGQGRMRMRGQQWQKPAGTPPPTPNPGSGADTSPDSQN
jgi:Spy/CpxP family protein refolding chaperone